MNMLTTLMNPTYGSSILGQETSIWQQRKIIGYCPQANLLWEKLTVYQHLYYFALMKVNFNSSQIFTGLPKYNCFCFHFIFV